jgi:hypothetical protein
MKSTCPKGCFQKLVGGGDIQLLVRLHEEDFMVLRADEHGNRLRAELDGEHLAELAEAALEQRLPVCAEFQEMSQERFGAGKKRR